MKSHKGMIQLKRLLNSSIGGIVPKNYDTEKLEKFNHSLKHINKNIIEKYGKQYTNNINILNDGNNNIYITLCIENDFNKYSIFTDINLQLNELDYLT